MTRESEQRGQGQQIVTQERAVAVNEFGILIYANVVRDQWIENPQGEVVADVENVELEPRRARKSYAVFWDGPLVSPIDFFSDASEFLKNFSEPQEKEPSQTDEFRLHYCLKGSRIFQSSGEEGWEAFRKVDESDLDWARFITPRGDFWIQAFNRDGERRSSLGIIIDIHRPFKVAEFVINHSGQQIDRAVLAKAISNASRQGPHPYDTSARFREDR